MCGPVCLNGFHFQPNGSGHAGGASYATIIPDANAASPAPIGSCFILAD
jgi:hypothetical protein